MNLQLSQPLRVGSELWRVPGPLEMVCFPALTLVS